MWFLLKFIPNDLGLIKVVIAEFLAALVLYVPSMRYEGNNTNAF